MNLIIIVIIGIYRTYLFKMVYRYYQLLTSAGIKEVYQITRLDKGIGTF